jgi:hypothetical protein
MPLSGGGLTKPLSSSAISIVRHRGVLGLPEIYAHPRNSHMVLASSYRVNFGYAFTVHWISSISSGLIALTSSNSPLCFVNGDKDMLFTTISPSFFW